MRTRRPFRRTAPGLVFALLLLPRAAGAQDAPELPDHPTLEDFVRVAEQRSPRLEASRRFWRAEAEAVDAVGSFPDPSVSFGWFAQEVETRVGPQKARVSVRQRLPWFGKLKLGESAAEEGAKAARARYDDRRLELRRDVTLAWLDLYWLGRASALTEENLELLVNLERVIRERYRIGRAAHADLIRLQVELGLAENGLRTFEDRLRPAIARMNALLHRPENAPVPVPEQLPEGTRAPDATDVFAAVRKGSPRLRERRSSVAQADAATRQAGRGRWPDWTVGADWIVTGEALNPMLEDSGKDAFIVTVSADLPLFRGKWDAPERAADERLVAMRSSLSFEEDELLARAEGVLFEWRDADRRVDLYRGVLLPKAHESYAALDTAYRTGQGAFLDLMEAERTLLEFELELERARTDRERSATKLRYLTGEPERGEDSP